ncbi:MAG TPA: hypothetical protein VK534_02545 [Methylomirabilota bacterium]|nr:hypothetical protein [Methylomirabilota bacterium]
MIEHAEILEVAKQARGDFEAGSIDRDLLSELYLEYNPKVRDIDLLLEHAAKLFPSWNCGLASVYVRHLLGDGIPKVGKFRGMGHTVLVLDARIADITADQFGGPKIYVGSVIEPWELVEPRHLQTKPHLLES